MKGIIKKEYENNMKKESKKWEKEKQKEETTMRKLKRLGVSGQLQAVRASSLSCPVVDVEPFHVGWLSFLQ